jgi:ankyrin repeat protein
MATRRVALVALLTACAPALAEDDAMDETMDMDLHRAAAANDTARLKALVASGAALDARDRDGRTALLIATRAGAADAARLLIEAGADVNAKDLIADTPFLYASAEGRLDILKLILATGRANLADTNRYGGNALIPAAHHGHPGTVRELLKTGIDVDHVNRLGWTALLEAIILSDGGPTHRDILAQLIAAGADVNRADGDGVSPLTHARRRGYREMAAMLEEAGAR